MIELSIVMPVFNEAATIINAIERVLAVDYPCRVELIVVDDGSTDGTARLLREYGDRGVTVMCHPVNRGKGAAVVTGVRGATGTHVVILDADLEYTPNDIPALLAPVLDGTADHVFGSRVFGLNTRFPSFRFAMGGRDDHRGRQPAIRLVPDRHAHLPQAGSARAVPRAVACPAGIRPRHRAHGDDAARGSASVRGADHLQRADARARARRSAGATVGRACEFCSPFGCARQCPSPPVHSECPRLVLMPTSVAATPFTTTKSRNGKPSMPLLDQAAVTTAQPPRCSRPDAASESCSSVPAFAS